MDKIIINDSNEFNKSCDKSCKSMCNMLNKQCDSCGVDLSIEINKASTLKLSIFQNEIKNKNIEIFYIDMENNRYEIEDYKNVNVIIEDDTIYFYEENGLFLHVDNIVQYNKETNRYIIENQTGIVNFIKIIK